MNDKVFSCFLLIRYIKNRLIFQYRGGVTVDGRGISSAGGLPTYKQPPKQAVSAYVNKVMCMYVIRFIANVLHVCTKTVTENWVIEALSVGTILAYLETKA